MYSISLPRRSKYEFGEKPSSLSLRGSPSHLIYPPDLRLLYKYGARFIWNSDIWPFTYQDAILCGLFFLLPTLQVRKHKMSDLLHVELIPEPEYLWNLSPLFLFMSLWLWLWHVRAWGTCMNDLVHLLQTHIHGTFFFFRMQFSIPTHKTRNSMPLLQWGRKVDKAHLPHSFLCSNLWTVLGLQRRQSGGPVTKSHRTL